MGGEDALNAMALNLHFRVQGPSGWHFAGPRQKKSPAIGGVSLQREVRHLRMPEWFGTTLLDLVRSGSLTLRKPLPLPDEFLLERKACAASHWRQATTTTQKRQHIELFGNVAFQPDQLNPRLRRLLNINGSQPLVRRC